MNRQNIYERIGLGLGALLLLFVLALPGCQRQDRREGAGADGTPSATETIAESDAERAKQDLNQQTAAERADRPAAPPTHGGRRAVDQPRVTPRR